MTTKLRLILTATFALAYMATARGADFPALQVTKGTRSIVLVGSQHAGAAQPGRSETVDALVAASSSVCMEADPRDADTARAAARAYANPPGVRLRDRLSPTTYEAAKKHLAFLPPEARNIDAISPFLLSTLLGFNVPDLRRTLLGTTPAASLDADIVRSAERRGKKIVAIEKKDAVAAAIDQISNTEWDAYIAGIVRILECAECTAAYGRNMVLAHSPTGDYEEVTRSLARAFASQPDLLKTYDRIYFAKRNADIARAIEREALDGARCSLVAIGIGHLGGEHGVAALLRQAGLTVAPLTMDSK